MLKRKMKGVSIETSSSPFSYDDEESRNRFSKHQSLIQDFNQLQKETDAMRKKLHRDKQRKLTLLAEVRFLRRRHKFLMRNQSPNTVTPRIERDLVRSQAPVSHKESYRKPSPVLDLNQISNYVRRVEQQQQPSDANMLSSKRKISWQDQVALKV